MEQTIFKRFTQDKIASFYELASNKFLANYRKRQLNNTDFSIISNNCWGGHVYRRYNLPYTSPTVGTYFFAEEYLRFCENLKEMLNSPIKIIDSSESKYADVLRKKGTNCPIGVINSDVEVVFLHYHTKEEAYEKWMRRAKRVNFDNLILKFSEMNFCSEEHIERFNKLNCKKKVLLLARPHDNIKKGIVVKRYTKGTEVINDTLYYDRYLNLNDLINNQE